MKPNLLMGFEMGLKNYITWCLITINVHKHIHGPLNLSYQIKIYIIWY